MWSIVESHRRVLSAVAAPRREPRKGALSSWRRARQQLRGPRLRPRGGCRRRQGRSGSVRSPVRTGRHGVDVGRKTA